MTGTSFYRLAAMATALPLAACSAQMSDERAVRAPMINVAGPPESCIQTSRIDFTEVHDDYTIDYVMRDNTRYRNTLSNRCYSLGFEQSFTYVVRGSSLCRGETIRVLHGDGTTGSTCGLGEFVPVELIEQ